MTKVRKKIGTIPINDIEQQVQQSTSAAITQMQQDVSDFIDEETAQYPEIGGTFKYIEDPEGRSEITTDSERKVISYRDSDGVKHEVVGIESGSVSTNSLNLSPAGMTAFQQALKDSGFNPGGSGDWSDYISNDGDNPLHLPMPRCAMLNIITDYDLTTLSKVSMPEGFPGVNCELPTQVEFWDMQGNYFKKWTLMSAQGNSSMFYNKKNLAFDFFDSSVEGDAFSVIFGNWIPQDSFHLKAYYTDYFRGSAIVAYHLIDDIELSRNLQTNRAWKKALINGKAGDSTYTDKLGKKINLRIDTGARCMPDGFPVIVYKNGEFYGIYSWQIKKHRDNYHMDKKSPKNIHLDADQIHQDSLFGGTILWNMFEIRNPKNLVYKSASVFDLYSDSATYNLGAIVRDSNNKALYKSKRDSNTGHALNETDWWFKFAYACYKYDADFKQAEIAGNADGSTSYPTWTSGTAYAVDVIVKHTVTIDGETEEHLFMNTVENNDKEPLITYDSNKDKWYNTDAEPDFKNKTKCGWLNVTLTVGVKENIIKLSHRMPEIDAAATPEAKNTLFNKYFDAENLYEYQIEQAIIGDYDGLSGKNWQWTTWDGVKWYANNYDKDCSFGNNSGGTYICPPFLTYGANFDNGWTAATGPLKYMNDSTLGTDYAQVKKDRYKELRRNGIISTNNIVSKLVDWTNRIGEIHYEMEYDKWNNCICNRGYELNEPWELFETHNYSEYISCPLYSDSDTYEAGDTVRVDVAEGLTYKIPDGYVGTVTGINPLKQLGHRDSIYRFENWVSQRISLFDTYCDYTDINN